MNYYPVCRCGALLDDTNYENGQCNKCANADYAKYKLLEAVEPAEIVNTSTANACKYLVKVHSDKECKRHKWYFASDPNKKPLEWYQTGDTSGNTMAGKELIVTDHTYTDFPDTYRYTDSLYIDKDDVDVIQVLQTI